MSAAPCSVRCGGQCCRAFPISGTSRQIAEIRAMALAVAQVASEHPPDVVAAARDDVVITDMLIPVALDREGQQLYTCTHFDPDTGLCTIYDGRPAMCRDYPSYGRPGDACYMCGYCQTPAAADPAEHPIGKAP